jgi:outer membrane protein assembly factor BamB
MRLKAVASLALVGMTVLLAACRGEAAPRQASDKPTLKPEAKQMRVWTDDTGQFRVRAALVQLGETEVKLRRTDGELISVPLERLSEADRQWLAKVTGSGGGGAPGEWVTFRGPNRDGRSPDKGLLKQWPEGGPPLLWKVDNIGQGYSSVVVSGGTIYITGEINNKLMIFALDMDGRQKWSVEAGDAWTVNYPGSRGSPTIDDGKLYVLSGHGVLGCFDASNGRRLWQRTAKEFGGSPGEWGYAESVTILDNLAIFKPGGPNCIVALDKNTGKPVWTSKGFSAGPEYSSCLAFSHDGLWAIAAGTREGIVCVDARNGNLLWANNFSANNTANCPTPVYSDGYIFWANGYGKGGICLKLGPRGTASQAWTTSDMVCHHGGYIIDNGYIYGNNGSGWACIELKTGKTMWRDRGVGKGSLCWADGMLYLFSESRGQAALATCSPERLEIKGRVQVAGNGPSWAHPVVIGGRLYLRYDTNLYCFDVKAK